MGYRAPFKECCCPSFPLLCLPLPEQHPSQVNLYSPRSLLRLPSGLLTINIQHIKSNSQFAFRRFARKKMSDKLSHLRRLSTDIWRLGSFLFLFFSCNRCHRVHQVGSVENGGGEETGSSSLTLILTNSLTLVSEGPTRSQPSRCKSQAFAKQEQPAVSHGQTYQDTMTTVE